MLVYNGIDQKAAPHITVITEIPLAVSGGNVGYIHIKSNHSFYADTVV